jgi:hypothetical protein
MISKHFNLIRIDVLHQCFKCFELKLLELEYFMIRVVDTPSGLVSFIAVDALLSNTFLQGLTPDHQNAAVSMQYFSSF